MKSALFPAAIMPVSIPAICALSRVAITMASIGVKPIVIQFSNRSCSYQPKPRPADPLSLPYTSFMPAAISFFASSPVSLELLRARSTASGVIFSSASPCCAMT